MKRKRPHAKAVCSASGKAAYSSPDIANKVRRQIKLRDGNRMQVYRCTHCKLWHLGHGDRIVF